MIPNNFVEHALAIGLHGEDYIIFIASAVRIVWSNHEAYLIVTLIKIEYDKSCLGA